MIVKPDSVIVQQWSISGVWKVSMSGSLNMQQTLLHQIVR